MVDITSAGTFVLLRSNGAKAKVQRASVPTAARRRHHKLCNDSWSFQSARHPNFDLGEVPVNNLTFQLLKTTFEHLTD